MTWILILGWTGFSLAALAAVGFILTSVVEKRWRAVGAAILLSVSFLGLFLVLLSLNYPGKELFVSVLLLLELTSVILFLIPLGSPSPITISGKQKRVDERDAILHRFYRLQTGSADFLAYYSEHPEKLEKDNQTRKLPRMGYPGSATYHALSSNFQVSIFDVLERITREIDWKPQSIESEPVKASPEEFTRRIKGFALYLGADLVGVTRLNPMYVYSHIGRSPGKWGEPITLNHTYAVAIAVEMRDSMIRHAPDIATTTETAFQYVEAAKVALLVSRYINILGYKARAHVDGNYRVLCEPIAVDAGLGELGRLGLVITPEFGPRVRFSVVTTDLPLVSDKPVVFGVQEFCAICKKCAVNCPSGAIDSGDKKVHLGVEKWQIEQDDCFRFWRRRGSDCSICVKVCPYSHPWTPMHNLVRMAIKRNALARRLALLGDDLFYGRRPREQFKLPGWHKAG